MRAIVVYNYILELVATTVGLITTIIETNKLKMTRTMEEKAHSFLLHQW